jgi:lysophospholipase L1-like esterase
MSRRIPATARARLLLAAGVAALTAGLVAAASPALAGTAAPTWVDAWAASPQSSAAASTTPPSYSNQTLRLITHLHSGGSAVRIKLSNTFGDREITFADVTVAVRSSGAAVGPVHALTFGGAGHVTIAKGAEATSDLTWIKVTAGQDLAVSLYLPAATGPVTYHRSALQTSYVSGTGDHSKETGEASFGSKIGSWPFLEAVSVHGGGAPGTIVALGDSITDGSGSHGSANHRWPDRLSDRLRARTGIPAKSVVDEGIAGNNILHDGTIGGPGALNRLDRDVLARRGLTDVILLEGINDLRGSGATADQVIAGDQQIIDRVHARGARIFGATLTPVEGCARYTATLEQQRQKLNTWIMTSGHFDGYIDFGQALADPADPLRMLSTYDSGDHLHPNDAGYQAMANAINLNLFT